MVMSAKYKAYSFCKGKVIPDPLAVLMVLCLLATLLTLVSLDKESYLTTLKLISGSFEDLFSTGRAEVKVKAAMTDNKTEELNCIMKGRLMMINSVDEQALYISIYSVPPRGQ